MKKKILLFQPFLRVHILNFGRALKKFEYVLEKPPKYADSKTFYQKQAGSAELEFVRNKVTKVARLRRILGILNVRIKFSKKADLLFTYGCLLITNRPYCIYIENGVTIFNYDVAIARNPLARLYLSLLVRMPQCKKLIFMSQTAYKSFLATTKLPPLTKKVIVKKAEQIYPYVKDPISVQPRKFNKQLRLLFTGVFYMKGGIETLNSFERLRRKYPDISLTIVTLLHQLRASDKKRIQNSGGVTLHDAIFSKEEMENIYRQHDIFLFPTFRDTFGLVLIEALSFGLPIIAIDQYAVTEMVKNNWNGFVCPDHPLTDYNRKTGEMYGRLYNAKDFYSGLFAAQASGKMKPIEKFLTVSITAYLENPTLLEKHSQNSLALYQKVFSEKIISRSIEAAFLSAINKKH